MPGMNVWGIANQKGGVGKSAAAMNLGHALAVSGARVLVLDLDPQATTTAITDTDPGEEAPTLYEVLAQSDALAEIIRPAPAWGFDVAPASLAMARLEQLTAPGSEFRLAEALTEFAEWLEDNACHGFTPTPYDEVLIDLPPSLGRLTLTGLVATTNALIVTEPSGPALRGVSDLLDTIDVVRRRYAPALELAGVVANRVQPTREAELRLAELREAFGDTLWDPPVPQRAAVAEALGAHVPVDTLRGEGARSAAEAFAALARRIRDRESVSKSATEQAMKGAI
jgi:chromosome partitioning protein